MILFCDPTPIRLPLQMTAEEGISLVKANERSFDARLDAAAQAILRDCLEEGIRIIRLSGPTCAGKTTTAEKLTSVLEAAGLSVYPISIDDFFYGRDVLEAMAAEHPEGVLDYDSVQTIDLPAIKACIDSLMEKGEAQIPVFDFTTGYAQTTRLLKVEEDQTPVFLFEGIQAVYPEVAALFEGIPSRSIFSNVRRSITLTDGERERVFNPSDIRLLRRLVRDEAKRGTTPDFTLALWESVRANEETSILPYADACDYGIDSAMAFDIHILAPHLRRIFEEHPCDGEEKAEAEAILASIRGVSGIPDDCLAPNSLYHEFIVQK